MTKSKDAARRDAVRTRVPAKPIRRVASPGAAAGGVPAAARVDPAKRRAKEPGARIARMPRIEDSTRRDVEGGRQTTGAHRDQGASAPAAASDLGGEINLDGVDDRVLGELTRRIQEIDNRYRAVAEKMGQLYMCADANKLATLTRILDRPMQNASYNEQTFAAILDELKARAKRRR